MSLSPFPCPPWELAFTGIYYDDLYLPFAIHDFFIAEASGWQCLSSFSTLPVLLFFMSVYAPVVTSKTLGPSQVLEFFGIELTSTDF